MPGGKNAYTSIRVVHVGVFLGTVFALSFATRRRWLEEMCPVSHGLLRQRRYSHQLSSRRRTHCCWFGGWSFEQVVSPAEEGYWVLILLRDLEMGGTHRWSSRCIGDTIGTNKFIGAGRNLHPRTSILVLLHDLGHRHPWVKEPIIM